MSHYTWDLIKYVVFNNPNSTAQELCDISGIPYRTITNRLPRLEKEWFITHANVWKPYTKRYYIKSKHLSLFRPNLQMIETPLEVHTNVSTPVKIWIGDNLVEYDPKWKTLSMNNKQMVVKWSESKYINDKTQEHRDKMEKAWKTRMTVEVENIKPLRQLQEELNNTKMPWFKWEYQ